MRCMGPEKSMCHIAVFTSKFGASQTEIVERREQGKDSGKPVAASAKASLHSEAQGMADEQPMRSTSPSHCNRRKSMKFATRSIAWRTARRTGKQTRSTTLRHSRDEPRRRLLSIDLPSSVYQESAPTDPVAYRCATWIFGLQSFDARAMGRGSASIQTKSLALAHPSLILRSRSSRDFIQ